MLMMFPAPFLLELLRNCLTTLKHAMLARGRVPPGVHWQLFGYDLDKLHLLDRSLLSGPRMLGVQRGTR